jgi:hypothetical protein
MKGGKKQISIKIQTSKIASVFFLFHNKSFLTNKHPKNFKQEISIKTKVHESGPLRISSPQGRLWESFMPRGS